MNITQPNKAAATPGNHHLAYWLTGIAALLAFALADVAAVALPAMVLSSGEVVAGALAFILIALGVLVTVWQLE